MSILIDSASINTGHSRALFPLWILTLGRQSYQSGAINLIPLYPVRRGWLELRVDSNPGGGVIAEPNI